MSDPKETEKTRPLVSVIIPTYGHGKYVPATLESVFAQTFTDFEIIVVNDGSPDDTTLRLQPLAHCGRIRYFEQPNGGQGAARNRGLAEARGEYIALLDDDDLWPPDKLSWQVEALRRHPEAAVVYGRVECINRHGDRAGFPADQEGAAWTLPNGPSGDIYDGIMEQSPIISPGLCLVRRSSLSALGPRPFDPSLGGCDDWDVWLQLARRQSFLFVDRTALLYRVHADNASRDSAAMCRSSLALRYKQYRWEQDPYRRARWRVLYRQAWSELAVLMFAEAKRLKGQHLRRAVLIAHALILDLVRGVGKLHRTGWRRFGRLLAGRRVPSISPAADGLGRKA